MPGHRKKNWKKISFQLVNPLFDGECVAHLSTLRREAKIEDFRHPARQPIAVSDISIYICLIDIRDGSCKPVYGGVDRLQALSSAKTGRRSCFFMN